MALVTTDFNINITPGAMPPVVHVSEYDIGRSYTVGLIGENNDTFTIPTGTTATIEGTLNGVVGFSVPATISNNKVAFTLTESMTAYAGKAWCKIKLTLNDEPIQTCAFIIAVDRAGVESETVIGAPGFEEQIKDAVSEEIANLPTTGGQPKPVTSAEEMTDTTTIYLYLGSEDGYEYGYIYVYKDGTWVNTGLYGKGQDGESPEVDVAETAEGVTITVNGNSYTVKNGENGTATDEQVAAWLDAHPEATTTVQDGSITEAKLSESLAGKISSAGYVYDEDGAKYSMAVVDGEIVLTRVYEEFPGKEIVAEFTPEDCVAIDGATGNVRYKLYNRATGEWNGLYFASTDAGGAVQPFFDNSGKVSTKARDMLLANSTGAVSFVFVVNNAAKIGFQNCRYYLGETGFYNFFGTKGWESLGVKLGVKYVNTSGESATFTLSETELETKLSDTAYEAGRWTEKIIAFSFNADGTISVLYDDMEMYKATISDWQSWDWENEFEVSYKSTGIVNYSPLQNHDRVTIVNDAITLQDLADYYNYIKLTKPATGIAAQDAIYMQPGDEVKLYAKASPDRTADTIKAEIADQTVAEYDGERITGLKNGSTTLKLTAGSITKDVQIYVGQQTGETITSERTIAEIAIANPVSELQVGDEWALYAIAKDADAVPYDVADDNIVTMSSSAPDVVVVEFGVLRARAPGTATITVADHTGSISKTMDVTVVAADDLTVPERDTYRVNDRTHNIYNDGTHPQETTAGLQSALDYAAEQNYRKIVFNPGTYLCNADYGVLTIPSGMIVDFNGAEIHLEYGSQAAAGYTFITIDGGIKTALRNLKVYAENAVQTGGSKSDVTLRIKGDSSRVRVENCAFLDSPGFNVSCHYTRTAVVGFKLSNVEAGGINADGTPETEAVSGRFRAKDYIDISKVGATFGLGNMQGYQGYLYMRARLYDIYFYDADKNLISSIKDCVQYQQYDKPDGAAYCKIVFYQADAPTSSDPDYASIAHIYTATQPRFCTFKDCRFERAVMTGLSPQGCIALTLDGCIFADNGSADPYAHIDWEDGRQHMQGHIVRDCSFAQSASKWHCNVEAPGGGRNIVMHGCTVQGGSVSVGSESQNWRMYHNDFRGTTVSLASKGDMVFAGNIVKAAPTTEAPVGGTIHLLDNTITG